MARPVPRFIPTTLDLSTCELRLEGDTVRIIQENPARCAAFGSEDCDDVVVITPKSLDEAHDLALAFRRAARRFEEIGRGMS
jgi:hypothetical protein